MVSIEWRRSARDRRRTHVDDDEVEDDNSDDGGVGLGVVRRAVGCLVEVGANDGARLNCNVGKKKSVWEKKKKGCWRESLGERRVGGWRLEGREETDRTYCRRWKEGEERRKERSERKERRKEGRTYEAETVLVRTEPELREHHAT